jgi:putative membrane protein
MNVLRRAVVLGTGGAVALVVGLATPADARASQPNDQDTTWMTAAHQSNLAEIAAGNAAVAQASTQQVKDLGQMFVDMHTQLDTDLTAAAEELGVELPAAPTPEQEAALADVASNSGAAFDTAWIAQQQASHRETLAATQAELENGADPTVIALAEAATPVVEQHIAELDAAAAGNGAPGAVNGGSGGQASTSDDAAAALPAALAGAVLIGGGAVAGRRLAVARRSA